MHLKEARTLNSAQLASWPLTVLQHRCGVYPGSQWLRSPLLLALGLVAPADSPRELRYEARSVHTAQHIQINTALIKLANQCDNWILWSER